VGLTEPFTRCIVQSLIRTLYRIGFLLHRTATLVLDVSSESLLRAVSHTLAYADVFDYPLTAEEVRRYLTLTKASCKQVSEVLSDGTLFARVGPYFTLREREEIIEIRKRRAEIAARLWPKAARYGQIIACLPFVRMVAVTGSLAMDNTEEGKDVDYMIVTAPNRLWICRALSLAVARFAKLEGISLCPNYLLTTNALELKERSLYVAHELAQMIPLSGMEIYNEMRRLNDWTDDYLPQASTAPEWPQGVKPVGKRPFMQKVLELLLSLPFGNWLEAWEMKRKIKKLTREQSSSVESYFSSDVCKGHIDKHGENTVTALTVRLQKTI
jgi:hypothetical protein